MKTELGDHSINLQDSSLNSSEYHLLQTKLKQMEAELQIAQIELDSIINNAGQAMRFINNDYTIRRVNRAFADLFHVDAEQVVGKKCWEVHPGPFCHTKDCCLKNILVEKNISKLEAGRVHSDGYKTTCFHEVIPFRSQNGELLGIVETFWNLSDQHSEDDKYRAILKASNDGYFVSNHKGLILDTNDSFCKLLGYNRANLMYKPLGNILFREMTTEYRRFINRLKKYGHVYFETIYQTNDGQEIQVEISANYFNAPDLHIFGLVRDITNRSGLDEELKKCRYRLEELVKERTAVLDKEITRRTEYTRALVHELKTPLTAIISSSEMLYKTNFEHQTNSRLAKNIFIGACKLNNRIEELLDLAKSELGTLKIHPKKINPMSIINGILDDFSIEASNKGHQFILKTPKRLPTVWADKERVQQIIQNLVNNAIKYNRRNGKIILSLSQNKDFVIFSVEDEGKGISSQDMQKLFLPYYRIESDRQRLSGLGLGLTLCKELVELHNGYISVESTAGKGSTFQFSVPKTKAANRTNI